MSNLSYAGPEAFPDNQIAEALVGKLKESRDHSCATHQQPLVLFCDEASCQITICALCIPDDHTQHNIVSLRSKAERKKQVILLPKIQKSKDLREKIANQRSKLNEVNEKIKNMGNNALQKVDKRYEELMEMHHNIRDKILTEMVLQSSTILDEEKKFGEAEQKLASLIENWLKLTNPHEILSEVKCADDKISEFSGVMQEIACKSMIGIHLNYTRRKMESLTKTLVGSVIDLPEIPVDPSPPSLGYHKLQNRDKTDIQNLRSSGSIILTQATGSHEGTISDQLVHDMQQIKGGLYRIIVVENSSSDFISEWIESNVDMEIWEKNLVFINSVVTYVCLSTIIMATENELETNDNAVAKIDKDKLKSHISMVFIDACSMPMNWLGIDKQVAALCGVQSAIRAADTESPPTHLIGEFFDTLFSEHIVDPDGFYEFVKCMPESSNDPIVNVSKGWAWSLCGPYGY